MRDQLTVSELRVVADTLYCGVPATASLMQQLRVFARGDEVLLWLVRNGLGGERMVEYFREASGSEANRGVLPGYELALRFIDGRQFVASEKLSKGDLR